MPKMKRFDYISSFNSGLSAYDKAYMYTTIEALQTLLQKDIGTYDGIHVHSDDAFVDIEKLRTFLQDKRVGVVGWWQQNGNFFAAMKMEKTALFYSINVDYFSCFIKYNFIFTYDCNE